MIDLVLTAGIPVVCGLLATLWFAARAWQPRAVSARRPAGRAHDRRR